MNSLLKRQIRKYLKGDLAHNPEIQAFLDAVDRSYANFDEQFAMQQRAMKVSSEELFDANQLLKQESKAQQELIDKLKRVIETLKFYEHPDQTQIQIQDLQDLDGVKLVDFIDSQTKEIVEINKQREILLNELAHQNQELSDYAHMVSHDLKSPLRTIDTLSTWIINDYENILDDSGKQNLNLIRSNVEKMDTLISGILQYSTISKEQIEFYDVDINKMVNEVLESIQIPKHITIEKSDLPTITGDKYRLKQLFQNLIDNAVKYNDKASGKITISFEDKKSHWKFAISDNGKGIEEQYFKKIFNTFMKLEDAPDSTGIGLSIVKKIVDLYQGEIWLTSKLNEGTTFFFTLKKQPDGTA
ncbi:sensor histidine kinase [Mesoflavibacter zeaxanthinifaciens]|uniref:sensor histidine kinase n=1 Tax=Mesoflavibacter zeaxanthinifaciens TaxID=393060 RepID=UPI003A93D1E3